MSARTKTLERIDELKKIIAGKNGYEKAEAQRELMKLARRISFSSTNRKGHLVGGHRWRRGMV